MRRIHFVHFRVWSSICRRHYVGPFQKQNHFKWDWICQWPPRIFRRKTQRKTEEEEEDGGRRRVDDREIFVSDLNGLQCFGSSVSRVSIAFHTLDFKHFSRANHFVLVVQMVRSPSLLFPFPFHRRNVFSLYHREEDFGSLSLRKQKNNKDKRTTTYDKKTEKNPSDDADVWPFVSGKMRGDKLCNLFSVYVVRRWICCFSSPSSSSLPSIHFVMLNVFYRLTEILFNFFFFSSSLSPAPSSSFSRW